MSPKVTTSANAFHPQISGYVFHLKDYALLGFGWFSRWTGIENGPAKISVLTRWPVEILPDSFIKYTFQVSLSQCRALKVLVRTYVF